MSVIGQVEAIHSLAGQPINFQADFTKRMEGRLNNVVSDGIENPQNKTDKATT